MILPWQITQWQQLWRTVEERRLPHALLFSGFAGTGKALFADSFARTLFCESVVEVSLAVSVEERIRSYCNTCHACRLIAGEAHPNVLVIEPEKEGQAIKIDQVRVVKDFVNQSSLQGDHRIVIIRPADAMNTNAANALLKTLEEPASGALMILINHQFSRLPATIISRCQRIHFPRPQTEAALAWLQQAIQQDTSSSVQSQSTVDKLTVGHETFTPDLLLQLAHGAPLTALRLLQAERLSLRHHTLQMLCALNQKQINPIQAAAKWQTNDVMQLLDWMLTWVMDLLRLQLHITLPINLHKHDNVEKLPTKLLPIVNQDYVTQLIALTTETKVGSNARLMEYLLQLRKQMLHGINLNKQLLLENIFIRWVACGKAYVSS